MNRIKETGTGAAPPPELLAPAGSLESFFAALEKGADAVYAGLHDFSARARAKNFSLAQMEHMLGYAHANGKRIYITLNTLVKERELPALVETLAALASMRADGLIVQDMGVARLVRNHFPSIPLHASTQMTIHNTPGVKLLEELGFTRAVLARELHLDEIRAIAAATTVEIETFVHGALCFCISGQCHFSSYLGGHSGNRGRCAQPCRRLYTHRGKAGHYFSPNDLSAIDLLPELARAGVKSLKIEGRMKSAEYVATVVAAYRLVLDAPAKRRAEAVTQAKELLKSSFGRTPTKGFLASHQPPDIASPWQKGGTGRYIGEVTAVKGDRISFVSRDTIHVGDRLRVQPKSDMAGNAWTVRDMFVARRKVIEALAGQAMEVVSPFRFGAGDSVFKVSSKEAFTISDNACKRRLDAAPPDRWPCRLALSLEPPSPEQNEGQGNVKTSGAILTIAADVAGMRHEFRFPLGVLEPSHTGDMGAVLTVQFARTGDAPFKLEALDASGFPAVVIPAARFKEVRRELYQHLAERVVSCFRERIAMSRSGALRDVTALSEASHAPPAEKRETLAVVVELLRDWRFPFKQGAGLVIIPLTRVNIHQLPQMLPRLQGEEQRLVWQLPFMLFDQDLPLYRDALRYLYEAGFRCFEASNPSHFSLLRKMEGVRISTSYRCFSLNSQALALWGELGAESATLYLEDDGENLTDLVQTGVDVECRILGYAPIPVMTTKIRMKEVHNNIPLLSDRGEAYSVALRDGLQVITASQPFSLSTRHGELRSRGCRSFVLDLSGARREEWGEIMAAFLAGRPIPGTTEFNYNMGLV